MCLPFISADTGAAVMLVNNCISCLRWSRCGLAEYFLAFIVLHFAVLCKAHEVAMMLLSLVIEDGM